MSMKHALLVSCAVLSTTVVVESQTSPPPPPASASAFDPVALPKEPDTSASKPTGGAVDLSALYYFASKNDLGRVAAEIKLIRAKNPDWQPPDNLFGAASGADEQPLWDMFASQDFAAIHAKMAEMKQKLPDWQPSSDLTGKLALAEAKADLVKASDAKQFPDVVRLASENKMLLTCSDVDALWRTAEALVETGNEPRAVAAYRYVLTQCTSPAERLATAQKASATLRSADALDGLLALGRRLPDGSGEFEQIRLDRFRRVIGDAIDHPEGTAPDKATMDAIEVSAKTPAGQKDAELLGWYAEVHHAYPDAQKWFLTALSSGTSPKAAEGLVMALRDNNQIDEARAAAVRYAGLDPSNRKLMVDIVAAGLTDPSAHAPEPDQMTAFTQAVDDLKSQDGAEALRWYADNRHDASGAKAWSAKWVAWKGEDIEQAKSAEGAEALGWQLYQNGDPEGAEGWFKKSADWGLSESAAVGLVLTAHRLRHTKDFESRVASYRGQYPRIAELAKSMGTQAAAKRVATIIRARPRPASTVGTVRSNGNGWDASADQIVKTFRAGNYDQALALMDQRQLKRKEPGGLSVIRGWAQYHQGDWAGAQKTFANLDRNKFSDQKSEGLRVIEWGFTNPRFR